MVDYSFRRHRNVVVLAGTGVMPDSFIDGLSHEVDTYDVTRILALAQGRVKMTSVQRRRVAETFKGLKVAGIADDAFTRGVITAISWLGLNIKGFAPDRLDLAMDYLDIEEVARPTILELVEEVTHDLTSVARRAP